MRTYRRKIQECNEIENVQELCRLCLDKTTDGFSIFKHEQDVCAAIAMRIMICVGLEMKQDDCLPNIICTKCYNELERYYKFRRKCEVTYQKLKSHMLALKCKEVKETQIKLLEIEQNNMLMEHNNIGMEHRDMIDMQCNNMHMEHKNMQIEDESMLTAHEVMKTVHDGMQIEHEIIEIENSKEFEYSNDIQSEPKVIEIEINSKQMNNNNIQLEPKVIEIEINSKQMENNEMQLELKDVSIDYRNVQIEHSDMQIEPKDTQIEHRDMQIENRGMQIECTDMPITQSEYKPISESPTEAKKLEISEEYDAQLLGQIPEKVSEKYDNTTEKVVETEQVPIPIQTESNPNIETFLSTILTELGLITVQKEGLMLQNEGIRTLELETGDDQYLVLELIEEDGEEQVDIISDFKLPSQVIVDVNKKTDDKKSNSKQSNKIVKKVELRAAALAGRGGGAGRWCAQCGRTFSSRSAAARHARAHAGARAHACPVCARAFAQKAVCDRHQLVHLEVRPHKCPQCEKSFTQRGSLAAHVRTHAGPHARALALHRCSHCDKVFLYASGLSRHMMTHMGRVYECSACDKQFTDRSSLLRHLRNFYHQV